MKNEKTKKEVIFETAKHLYYEKGFNSTSFEEIAEKAGVQKTLVQYHYITKANLGNDIYGSFSIGQFEVFTAKVSKLDHQYSIHEVLIAYTLKTVEYYKKDDKAFRFYREFFSNAFEHITAKLEDLSDTLGLTDNLSPEYIHAIYISTQYALRGVIYHYVKGEIKLSKNDFDRFLVEMLLSSGIYGNLSVDEILKSSEDINNSIKISYEEDFTWS